MPIQQVAHIRLLYERISLGGQDESRIYRAWWHRKTNGD